MIKYLMKLNHYMLKFFKILDRLLLDFFMPHGNELSMGDKIDESFERIFRNIEEPRRLYTVDISEITDHEINKIILMCAEKEDTEFQENIKASISTLIKETKNALSRTEVSFVVKEGVEYQKLILFLATIGRVLAKKKEEKGFILDRNTLASYIVFFLKEFDEDTRDFIKEFLDDLIDTLLSFISLKIQEN